MNKNKRILNGRHFLLFTVLLLSFLLMTTNSNAQNIDVTKCGDSATNAKKCIEQFVDQLVKAKQKNQDQVTLLKSRKLGTDALKEDYEAARNQVANVVVLLTRDNPDFTSIKREFLTAQNNSDNFYKKASLALDIKAGGGLGLKDNIINWFFDNACKFLPNTGAEAACDEVVKYLKKLNLDKKANWKSWDEVPLKLKKNK